MSSTGTDLDSLKWSTILEYNQLNAFGVSTDSLASTTYTKYDDITTSSYKTSSGLLSKVSDELEKMKTNLQLMLNYSIEGDAANNDKEKETAYAQIRSLSAGVDSIVRSYKLQGVSMLTGRDYELSYGSETPLKMSMDNLSASYDPDDEGEDNIGLQLATADEGGSVSISYDYLNTLRNATASVSGLDITGAYTTTGNATHAQLSDGGYQVEVKYSGPNSKVYIEDLDGTVIDSLDADLSGSGQVDLKFACGVGLSIEKDSWALGADDIDKYDYKTNGPVSLYANLTYDTVKRHNLNDGTGNTAIPESSVTIAGSRTLTSSTGTVTEVATLKGTTGSVNLSTTATTPAEGRTAMETGNYTAQVRYNGAKSSVWLYDEAGTLMSTVRDVDLTKDASTTVDLGVGVAITLDPSSDFTSSQRNYTTTLNYTAKQDAYEVFDFDEYYDVISNALTLLEENISTVSDAQEALDSQYSIVQSAVKLANSGGTSSTSSLMSVLSGGSSGVSASSLFSTLNSSGSSSTQTVLSASSSSIISCLTGAVTSLSDVDNDILALYY